MRGGDRIDGNWRMDSGPYMFWSKGEEGEIERVLKQRVSEI